MTILDKLLEKKDLLNYIGLRIQTLRTDFDVMKYPEAERELQNQRLNGRLRELKKLKTVILRGELKDVSKRMWRDIDKNDKVRKK